MKNRFAILITAMCLMSAFAFAARPQVILGPGTGGTYFRVPYHQNWNRVLSADTVYILTAWYFVDSTYSITIPAGTLIRGDSASGGTLIIKRGAQIFASGTANNPIVFTSNKPAGTRQPGDWGGVIICGKAPINQPNTTMMEGGFNTIAGAEAMYGGDDPNDNSGIFQYVRLEFGGIAFSQDNEINGITFCGVGAGTTLNHIQVSFANDDDFEWFGGTVNAKYLVGWRSLDDCFDTDFGFAGKIQFCYSKRDPLIFDYSAPGQSNGEESDNMGTAPYIADPRTKARFCNWTLVGPLSDTSNLSTLSPKWGYVAMLRRATEFSVYNSIMMGWGRGINIRDTLTQRAAIDGRMELRNISLQAPREVIVASSSPSTGNIAGFNVATWFNSQPGNIGGTGPRQTTDIGLPAALWNLDNTNNPVPPPSSEPATAGTLYQGRLAGETFYDSVSYRGAFDPTKPMSQQWTAGWTNFDPQNYNPDTVTTTTVNVGVNAGWNLVSVPVVPPDSSAPVVFPGSFGDLFRYEAGSYVPTPYVRVGPCYWAYYSTGQTVNITGPVVAPVTVSLAAGWNLVGSRNVSVDKSLLTTNPTGQIFGDMFAYSGGSYVPVTVLAPGGGVWMYVLATCTLTIP